MVDKWYYKTPTVLIPIPDEDIPAVLKLISIEKAKIKKLLAAKIFDGGQEIISGQNL